MRKIITFLPFVLLILVFIIDFSLAWNRQMGPELATIREIFLLVSFLLLIPALRNIQWVSDQKILTKLRTLFIIFIVFFVFSLLAESILMAFRIDELEPKTLYSSLPTYLYSAIISMTGSALTAIVLFNLRDLIFAKRKKYTQRIFNLLLLFMALQILLRNVVQLYFHNIEISKLGSGIPYYITLFTLIVFFVINSFRNSWINYLNKKQKIACFWGAFILLPVTFGLSYRFSKQELIYSFSPSLGGFLEVTTLFFCIYLVMAFFGLLFHLPTAGLFDRKLREVASLHELSRTVSSVLNINELVASITRLIRTGSQVDFSWLLLFQAKENHLQCVSTAGIPDSVNPQVLARLEDDWAKTILTQQTPLLANEVPHEKALQRYLSPMGPIGSLLAVPLVFSHQVKGILFAAKQEEFGFEQEDQVMLQAFANQAVTALENANLIKQVVEKELFEQELKIAHDAQMKLLPKTMPQVSSLDIQATCITANEVGGDYYDFFKLEGGKLGLAIGDVSGKGPSAAFYMAQLKGIMSSFAQTTQSPRELLIKANQALYDHIERTVFVTMNYAIIDTQTHLLTFARAGHCPPILLPGASQHWQVLEPRGLGLGMDDGQIFSENLDEAQVQLHPGDVLFLYTDGVTEARNSRNEEFQEGQVGATLTELQDDSALEIKDKFVKKLMQFVGDARQHDDLTFIIVKVIS